MKTDVEGIVIDDDTGTCQVDTEVSSVMNKKQTGITCPFWVGLGCVLSVAAVQNDTCGVRTHALPEWRLKPPP